MLHGHPNHFGVPSAAPFLIRRSGALRGCDFFLSCDSVVPLKRDSNHLSSLPGIPLPLHAGLFSFVPAGTWPRRQHEIVCRLNIAVASRWIDPSASQAQRQNDRGREGEKRLDEAAKLQLQKVTGSGRQEGGVLPGWDHTSA